jgi:membrane-associated protease RseP (regulator of RpoE activity)
VSDSSERQLRSLARTIDSLVRVFESGDRSAAERSRVGRRIDGLIALYKAQRMQLDGASTVVKIGGPYIANAPEPPDGPTTYVELKGMIPTPMPPAVARGWIGIVVSGAPRETHMERDELMMRFLSYPEITSVDPSSPAQRAGLAPGDTLLAYDGQDVRGADISMTRLLRPNAKVVIRVRRDGRIKEMPDASHAWVFTPAPDLAGVPALAPPAPAMQPRTFTPTAPPPVRTAPAPAGVMLPRPFELSPSGVAGAQLVTISDGLKRSYGLPSGVLVNMVPVGTPAYVSGLKEGDVIVRVERQPVQSVAQLWQIVTRADDDGAREVDLDLIREKQARTIKLRW